MSEREVKSSIKEQVNFFNTLTGLVKALEGRRTIVDLRNDCYITGKIKKVDGYMNVDMEDVIYYDARGKEHVFSNFFVNKRNIVYVHIPDDVTATQLIKKQLDSGKRPLQKQSHTFKRVRAKRYNEEILQSAYKK